MKRTCGQGEKTFGSLSPLLLPPPLVRSLSLEALECKVQSIALAWQLTCNGFWQQWRQSEARVCLHMSISKTAQHSISGNAIICMLLRIANLSECLSEGRSAIFKVNAQVGCWGNSRLRSAGRNGRSLAGAWKSKGDPVTRFGSCPFPPSSFSLWTHQRQYEAIILKQSAFSTVLP